MKIDIRRFSDAKNNTDNTTAENNIKMNLADIIAAATTIKENRKGILLTRKPLPVQRFAHYPKAFICKNKEGRELSVGVTDHAFEQFARRYQYYDPFFLPASIEQVENKMREVFNKGFILSNNGNQKYGNNQIQWISGSICFIVDIKHLIIITTYLVGKFAKFNQHPWRFLGGELKCKLFAT